MTFAFAPFQTPKYGFRGWRGAEGGSDVAVRITGPYPNELFGLADRIKQKLNEISSAQNIADDWGPKIKKVVVDIDQSKTQNAGLTNQDIALSLKTALTGFNTGAFREATKYPHCPAQRKQSGRRCAPTESINIYGPRFGQNVPLGQVAHIVPQWQLPKDQKRDLYRTMTVTCDAKSGFYGAGYHRRAHPFGSKKTANRGSRATVTN